MNIKRTLRGLAITALFMGMSGCAHSYHYTPEIAGNGAMWSAGAVMFEIPAKSPAFDLRVMARSVRKMIHIRMDLRATKSAAPNATAAISLSQQVLLTQNGRPIRPSLVRTSTKNEAKLKASPKQKQVVDLFYALPKGVDAGSLQHFLFQWSIELAKGQVEQQTTRFDRNDSASQQSEGFTDFNDSNDLDQAVVPPGLWY